MLENRKAPCSSVKFQFFCLTAEYTKQIDDTKNKQKPMDNIPRATRKDPVIPQNTPKPSIILIKVLPNVLY